MKNILAALALSFLSFLSLAAHAQGFLEFGIGQSSADLDDEPGVSVDDEDTTWAISGGYMFHPLIGGEVGYRQLGEISATARGPAGTGVATIEVTGFTLGLVGRIPLGERFELVPRFGFYVWELDLTAKLNGSTVATDSDDGTDPYFGIGAQFAITRQAHIGAHFARFDIDGDDVDVLELRAGVRF